MSGSDSLDLYPRGRVLYSRSQEVTSREKLLLPPRPSPSKSAPQREPICAAAFLMGLCRSLCWHLHCLADGRARVRTQVLWHTASPAECVGCNSGYIWSTLPPGARAPNCRGKRPGAFFVLGAGNCSNWKRTNRHWSHVHTSSHITWDRPHRYPGTPTADRLAGMADHNIAKGESAHSHPKASKKRPLPPIQPAHMPGVAVYLHLYSIVRTSASRGGRTLLPTLRSPSAPSKGLDTSHANPPVPPDTNAP